MRVFFSSLRCFFFAIRLRRFLMTEPIRPPSLRHNGRRARHSSPAAGRLGTRPKLDRRVNDNRSRSALAYLLPHGAETAIPGAGAPGSPVPGVNAALRLPQGTPSRPPRKHSHGQPPGFAGAAHRPLDVWSPRNRPLRPEHNSWVLRAVPVARAQQPVPLLRPCRRRPPSGTG
jgi:hypothetical protein